MGIFINYRRMDSKVVTRRIYDRLVEVFGEEIIYRDLDSMPLGVGVTEEIKTQIIQSDVLLAVIGRTWLDCKNDDGERRLYATEDWVREEIEIGLEIWIHVIPVLVGGAQMPKDEELPDSIRKLADQNWVEIGDGPKFHRDMDRLINKLQKIPSQMPSRLNREDVQNIIVSARRQGKTPDLRNRNLVGIDLDGEDLSKADFTKANLSFARMEQTNLENTILQGANLYYAKLYRAHIKGANLRRAHFKKADLIKPTLTDADLSEVDLKATRVDFDDANLEYAKLFETDLSNLDLKKAILFGAEYSSGTKWPDGFDPEKAGAVLIK